MDDGDGGGRGGLGREVGGGVGRRWGLAWGSCVEELAGGGGVAAVAASRAGRRRRGVARWRRSQGFLRLGISRERDGFRKKNRETRNKKKSTLRGDGDSCTRQYFHLTSGPQYVATNLTLSWTETVATYLPGSYPGIPCALSHAQEASRVLCKTPRNTF